MDPPPPGAFVLADNRPLVLTRDTVIVSCAVTASASEMLMPAIFDVWSSCTPAEAGAVIAGGTLIGVPTFAVLLAVAVAVPGTSSDNVTVTASLPGAA